MPASITYDGQLSGAAYLVLTGMTLLIVGGLCWCFYRALKASSQKEEQQYPDEI